MAKSWLLVPSRVSSTEFWGWPWWGDKIQRAQRLTLCGVWRTAGWGGGLPREGAVVEEFRPLLESLSSLGFEGGSMGCPEIFAVMSRTSWRCSKVFQAQKKRAQTQTFESGYFPVGWGSSTWRGGSQKSSACPLENQGNQNFLGWISRDFAVISRRCPKKFEKKNVCVQFLAPKFCAEMKLCFSLFGPCCWGQYFDPDSRLWQQSCRSQRCWRRRHWSDWRQNMRLADRLRSSESTIRIRTSSWIGAKSSSMPSRSMLLILHLSCLTAFFEVIVGRSAQGRWRGLRSSNPLGVCHRVPNL